VGNFSKTRRSAYLADVGEAAALANDWNQLSQEKVQSWDQANEGTMSVFSTQDIVRNTMTIAILVVAGFGIYNILSMAVNHKRRDIAILRSMGYLPKQIVQLFLIQGLILGAIGGVIGCGLGYVACLGIEMIPVSGERGLGGNHQLMVYFPGIYLRGFLLAFLSSVLASYFPARVAGNLNPIEIIRTGGS
jgi:lipoprotein-releasing system permease protein